MSNLKKEIDQVIETTQNICEESTARPEIIGSIIIVSSLIVGVLKYLNTNMGNRSLNTQKEYEVIDLIKK
jgi:hypothetical protein